MCERPPPPHSHSPYHRRRRPEQVIKQIKEMLGVGIRISPKGEFLPGTTDRVCTITGMPESVEIAQRIIKQKVEGRLP